MGVSSSEARAVMRCLLAVVVLALATTLVGCVSMHDSAGAHAAHDHASMHAPRPLREGVNAAAPCRAGAFVEASNIINSVVEIAMALPANTPERTRAELDTVLFTALKQAKSEVHCVAGVLSFGYDRSYAGVIRRGVALAQSRRLSTDIVELGNSVVAAIEANRSVAQPAPMVISPVIEQAR